MSETKHAVLSPSSSSRWMSCPGSVVLEEGEPNNDNEYSREGTLAHAVAAHCLQHGVDAAGITSWDLPDRTGLVKKETVSEEMREYVQEYVDFVREKAEGHHLLVEQGLDLSWLTNEPDAIGTADAVIIHQNGETLHLIDFKYGFNEVPAQDNSQLRIYGLAAGDVFEMLGDYKNFKLGIYQPRINNIDDDILTLEEMKKFEEEVRAAVKRVEEARKSNSLEGFLKTGKHCKWCRAAAKCPKLTQEIIDMTGVDFEDETQHELIDPVDLAKVGAKLELLEGFLKSARRKIEAEIFAGRPVKGWKLVEGKKGNRAWIDDDDVKKAMKKLGIKEADMTVLNLLSPAKLEKKLKGNDTALAKLPALYSQKPGRPAVAPLSDKRPAYTAKPEDDFEDVE